MVCIAPTTAGTRGRRTTGSSTVYREYTLNRHALPGLTYRSTVVGPLVLPGSYSAKLTVNGKSYTQTFDVVPDPRVTIPPAALSAQFRLQQRMVAGITATYDAFNFIQQAREAVAGRPIETALLEIVNGPAGIGAAHRDLARRLNDMLVGDVEPTPSVVAGVDAPCRAIDAALDRLRQLQAANPVPRSCRGGSRRLHLPLESRTIPRHRSELNGFASESDPYKVAFQEHDPLELGQPFRPTPYR